MLLWTLRRIEWRRKSILKGELYTAVEEKVWILGKQKRKNVGR